MHYCISGQTILPSYLSLEHAKGLNSLLVTKLFALLILNLKSISLTKLFDILVLNILFSFSAKVYRHKFNISICKKVIHTICID